MKINKNALAAICMAILAGVLTAGLWPFARFPKNEVVWLENEHGLRFGDYGSIFSSGTFQTINSKDDPSCSIEIWLQPGLTYDQNTMVAFYTPQNPIQFRLRQSGADLFVLRELRDQQDRDTINEIRAEHVFQKGKRLLITITSGKQGTAVYLDGNLVQVSLHFGLTRNDFTGQLIVGGAPLMSDSWSGTLRGLAIYSEELTPSQVLQHFDMWTKNEPLDFSEAESAIAVYTFDERTGRVVHNLINSEPDLYIPDHFKVLHQLILERPWEEFHPDWHYCWDLLINIGGFVPLGFFFCAYFSSRRIRRPVLTTIILGGAVSLTIEVLQAYIPTRSSGVTDLITNTIGTAIGAIVFSRKLGRSLLVTFGIPIPTIQEN
jgi:VanZ family protein